MMHCTVRVRCRLFLLSWLVVVIGWGEASSQGATYDLMLTNGTVFDGTGSEGKVADVAVLDGKIAAIGELDETTASLVIDCTSLVVCPGFIDLHTHSDGPILEARTRASTNYLLQGCTTAVTGNCGSGPTDVAAYFKKIDEFGAGTHVIHLLPQGSLRSRVMGQERRPPTDEERKQMLELAAKAMQDGAYGMSTGLIYVPSMFAETDELIEIAKVVAEHGGIYASHIRGEGTGLLDSIQEVLEIAEKSGARVHVSHFKASGRDAWGSLHLAIKMIEEARGSGVEITADQYPYAASSTSLEATLFPVWSREGGRSQLKKRLDDPETAAQIRTELIKKIENTNRIQIAVCQSNPEYVGRSLDEIAAAQGIEVADLALQIQRDGGASVVNFGMDENDVRSAMTVPWVATASDGGTKIASGDMPHPRSFGTFPRKIGRYAIEEKTLSLAQAIRSASGLPAEILGLVDRGFVKEGYFADLVVFDPMTFRDQATFEKPYLPPTGMRHVFVDGVAAVYEGQATGALAGRVLRKPPRAPEADAVSATDSWSREDDAGSAVRKLTELIADNAGKLEPFAMDFSIHQPGASCRDLPIGVFDSGIGGLTVLETLLTIDQHNNVTGQPGSDGRPDFEDERFVYLGDQANMPYGNYAAADREGMLRELILKDAVFLLGNRYWPTRNAVKPSSDKPSVKAIVIACNTATAFGLEDVRYAVQHWGLDVPVLGVVEAGATAVVRDLEADGSSGGIGVLATVGTCSSEAYPRTISRLAGQSGKRQPLVWQQGSVGLAGAIEGNRSFLTIGQTESSTEYLGPRVQHAHAALDPRLKEVYAFEPEGLVGDFSRPETWRLNSIANYVRYDVTSLVEAYRQSGATKPLEYVVLGCTHFPFETERIASEFQRLREYKDAEGSHPYEQLIAPEVKFVDPNVMTAQQLFRQLVLDQRRASGIGTGELPRLMQAYVSVPTPGLPAERVDEAGGLTTEYKYGRVAGRFEEEETRFVPIGCVELPGATDELLRKRCPKTYEQLSALRTSDPR